MRNIVRSLVFMLRITLKVPVLTISNASKTRCAMRPMVSRHNVLRCGVRFSASRNAAIARQTSMLVKSPNRVASIKKLSAPTAASLKLNDISTAKLLKFVTRKANSTQQIAILHALATKLLTSLPNVLLFVVTMIDCPLRTSMLARTSRLKSTAMLI